MITTTTTQRFIGFILATLKLCWKIPFVPTRMITLKWKLMSASKVGQMCYRHLTGNNLHKLALTTTTAATTKTTRFWDKPVR
jgi:hypothetical protein